MEKFKYAITGNKGLIGSFLKKRLDDEGHKCVLQIDKRQGFDIMDLMFKETELTERPDIFFHLASQCKINEAIASPILPHKNNCDGILAVLEFCRKHKIPKIVVMSSSRVLSPERNPYVASKIYVEELTKAYYDCYGIEYIIIRPSTVYGPMFDETSRLINNWLTNAFKEKDLKLYGDDTKTLDFTYIDDFINGVMLTLKAKWNNEYNLSGGNETNLFDLAHYIIEKSGSNSEIKLFLSEVAQPQKVHVDISAIKKIGYKPKTNIWKGVIKMINFYKDNPSAWKNYKDKGEIYYNGK